MLMMAMGTVIPEIHRLSNLSVYSWMEGAAVATTTAVGAGAVVAGLSYASGAVATVAEGTAWWLSMQVQLLSGGLPARPSFVALLVDHPGPLRDRGGRRRVWWFTDSTAKLNPS